MNAIHAFRVLQLLRVVLHFISASRHSFFDISAWRGRELSRPQHFYYLDYTFSNVCGEGGFALLVFAASVILLLRSRFDNFCNFTRSTFGGLRF